MNRYQKRFFFTGMSLHLAGAGVALLMLIFLTRSAHNSVRPKVDFLNPVAELPPQYQNQHHENSLP